MNCLASPVRLTLAIVGSAALITSTACGAAMSSGGGDPFRGSGAGGRSGEGAREIRIEVNNTNFNGGTVYTIRSGSRRRLGRVEGGRDESFTMPWTVSERLSFEVDLLGREGCMTRPVVVSPGQSVILTIFPQSRPTSSGISSLCDVRGGR